MATHSLLAPQAWLCPGVTRSSHTAPLPCRVGSGGVSPAWFQEQWGCLARGVQPCPCLQGTEPEPPPPGRLSPQGGEWRVVSASHDDFQPRGWFTEVRLEVLLVLCSNGVQGNQNSHVKSLQKNLVSVHLAWVVQGQPRVLATAGVLGASLSGHRLRPPGVVDGHCLCAGPCIRA